MLGSTAVVRTPGVRLGGGSVVFSRWRMMGGGVHCVDIIYLLSDLRLCCGLLVVAS